MTVTRAVMGLILGVLVPSPGSGQTFSQRGFFEIRPVFYPQTVSDDHSHVVAEGLFRYSASYSPESWLKLNVEAEARTDTHWQTERGWHLDIQDRGLRRPAFSIRRGSVTLHGGGWTLELGKQFVRWGKADVLNPTDRFAPRDYLTVFDQNDFLGVLAARATYEHQGDTLDVVLTPRFTPSRTPLLNERWTVLPPNTPPVRDMASQFPGGAQIGARWNHVGHGYEASVSFFDGFNHLPLFNAIVLGNPVRFDIGAQRYYPQMRMYGVDAAVPMRWLTLKVEGAYFTSSTRTADEYALYVIQLERQAGEWFFVGGYAGQAVTLRRGVLDFEPDRGLTRAFVGRAGYTIDTSRSVALETAIRQNGEGSWVKLEYSQLFGQHWRVTGTAALIRGNPNDFIGQYRHNSYGALAFRYSF